MKYIWITAAIWTTPVLGQPMWELSDHWACSLERHMRTESGAEVVEMVPTGHNYVIDFNEMTITSAFVDGKAEIVHKSHHTAGDVAHNILVDAWPFGHYPSVYMERGGEAWSVNGSGTLNDGKEVWIAIYRCVQAASGT